MERVNVTSFSSSYSAKLPVSAKLRRLFITGGFKTVKNTCNNKFWNGKICTRQVRRDAILTGAPNNWAIMMEEYKN
jgi:hypothetical protein